MIQDAFGVFVPTINLIVTIHVSMRASIGYKAQITLYETTGAGMAAAKF